MVLPSITLNRRIRKTLEVPIFALRYICISTRSVRVEVPVPLLRAVEVFCVRNLRVCRRVPVGSIRLILN